MARRGENIYKRKDNRWEGRYIKGYDIYGKSEMGYVYAKTYREVKEKLTKAKLLRNTPKASPKKDFAFFCDEWLTISRNRVKEATYVKYRNTIFNHIKPRLGNYPVQKLNTVIIENFSNELLSGGLSAKSVKDILILLGTILKYCKKQLGTDFSCIEIIYPKEEKKEMRVLSIEEQKKFISFLLTDMDEVKFGILLALFTGMRIGEICALKWEDISLTKGIIAVNSTMQRLQTFNHSEQAKTKVVIGSAKSETSRRVIPLSGTVLNLCYKMYNINGSAFVLTGERNRFFEPRALQYRLGIYTKQCNLEGVHFHTLRHTFATRCVEVGFELKSLSEILGHSSAKVTLDRYVHSSLALKKENMEKLAVVGL